MRATVTAALSVRPGAVHVAVSGGADSVALLGLLHLLRGPLQLRLSVGHVDHGLRAESGDEAQLVRSLAARFDLPCDVTRVQLDRGPSLAARARVARYAALRAQGAARGVRWLALGHTATDQAETMLMHLARGAGLGGLAGMRPISDDLVRPLLETSRARARQLAGQLGLRFVDDPTNADARHARVALRRHVLPVLRELNPRFEQAAVGAARQLAAADEALDAWTQRAFEALVGERPGDGPWSCDPWAELPRAVSTRLVLRICAHSGVALDALAHDVVEAIDDAARAQAGAHGSGAPAGGVPPRRWDLRPQRTLYVDKRGICVRCGPGSNH